LVAGLRGNQGIDLGSVSRAKIEKFGTPILRATVASRGLDLLLSPRDVRGDVVTWESAEGITFAFRNGVLIESRGLGADLMSSSVPSPEKIANGASYSRSYFYVADDDQNQRRDYACSPEARGPEAVMIYGKTHQTRHVAEPCLRDVGRITNDFWLEGGTIRKSRQWVSPDIGYVEFSRVVD
jgi:Group 4 capsule polysaccharide lipoprotein gfcB, YjbF